MHIRCFIYLFFITFLVRPTDVLAWGEETHELLSMKAEEFSIIGSLSYLKDIGIEKGLDQELTFGEKKKLVKEWVQEGASLEDSGNWWNTTVGTARFVNHFHNPLKDWSNAGLTDVLSGESSLLWAQDDANQSKFLEGDRSWKTIRNLYYLALTSNADAERQSYFAQTFRGLGHQVHLVQDKAVPAHVKNDAHPLDSVLRKNYLFGNLYFESWAKKNPSTISSLASHPVFPNLSFTDAVAQYLSYNGYVPITKLYDTDQYTENSASHFFENGLATSLSIGLAEYTNANFFSDDTIFAAEKYPIGDKHYFPYPKKSSTNLEDYENQNSLYETIIAEDGIPDIAFYIKKNLDGELIEHFVKPTYLTNNVKVEDQGTLYYRTFYADEECHKDYVTKLVPRAVGYSAGLLNYFFRGQMDTNGHETADSNGNVASITVDVKNLTAGEDMSNGRLVVSYRYKASGSSSYTYGISSELNSGTLTANAVSYTTYAFTFDNPIPKDATEVQYILVFHEGYLGNEQNAVAAKVINTEAFSIKLTRDDGVLLTPSSLADTTLPGPARSGADIYIGLYDSFNNWVTGGAARFFNGKQTYSGITFDEKTSRWKLNLPLGYKEPAGNKGFWMEYSSSIGTAFTRYPHVYHWSKFEDEKNLIRPGSYEDTIPLWWIEGPMFYPDFMSASKTSLKVHSSVPYLVRYSFSREVGEYIVANTDPTQYLYYGREAVVTVNGSAVEVPCIQTDRNSGGSVIIAMESNAPSIDGTNFEETWMSTDYCQTDVIWHNRKISRDIGGISAGFEF